MSRKALFDLDCGDVYRLDGEGWAHPIWTRKLAGGIGHTKELKSSKICEEPVNHREQIAENLYIAKCHRHL